jgi:hypothetical protein
MTGCSMRRDVPLDSAHSLRLELHTAVAADFGTVHRGHKNWRHFRPSMSAGKLNDRSTRSASGDVAGEEAVGILLLDHMPAEDGPATVYGCRIEDESWVSMGHCRHSGLLEGVSGLVNEPHS